MCTKSYSPTLRWFDGEAEQILQPICCAKNPGRLTAALHTLIVLKYSGSFIFIYSVPNGAIDWVRVRLLGGDSGAQSTAWRPAVLAAESQAMSTDLRGRYQGVTSDYNYTFCRFPHSSFFIDHPIIPLCIEEAIANVIKYSINKYTILYFS